MKVAVLGGSTPHTVAMLEAVLDAWTPGLPDLELHLVGRNPERTETVAGFCRRRAVGRGFGERVKVASSTSLAEGCRDAEAVAVQVRAGGLEARALDETFPREFVVPGDEGLGPGGLAAAMRTFPLMEEIADVLPAPGSCLVLMLTNPLGLCCRRLEELWPGDIVGVCELPERTLEDGLGHAPGPDVQARYTGMNHQGFWYEIKEYGKDCLPEILTRQPEWARGPELHGALPLPYLRLYFNREKECEKQAARGQGRAMELIALREKLLTECRAGDGTAALPSGTQRETPWYDQVVAPILAGLAAEEACILYGDTPAGTGHPFAPEKVVVERKLRIESKVTPAEEDRCPESLRPFLSRIAQAEEQAFAAALTKNEGDVVTAVRAHPLCDHLDDFSVRSLAQAVMQAAGV